MLVTSAAEEFRTLRLRDRRLEERAQKIMRRLEVSPDVGFPQALKEEAEVEAFYRFTANPRVEADDLNDAHGRESWSRAGASGSSCLVLHDTTELAFPGESERVGLEKLKHKSVLHAHVAIAVAEIEPPSVYGVVGMRSYVVERGAWLEAGRRGAMTELLAGSQRWGDLVAHVHATSGHELKLIHVMDREADDYALFAKITSLGGDFVIRSKHDRTLSDGAGKLKGSLAETEFVVGREVHISRRGGRRPPGDRKTHPDRDARLARLHVRFGEVDIQRPSGVGELGSPHMRLWMVEVVELQPPEGHEPVHWRLLTSLPIHSAADALRVVDIYRKRWLIEEYFRTLKTGCSAEARQAESLHALQVVIALLTPIAWRLMTLRALARQTPDAPASLAIDEVELQALRHLSPKAKFSPTPKVSEVVRAIARLGGHLTSNGQPGILVLFRGLQQLLLFAEGWRAALRALSVGGISE